MIEGGKARKNQKISKIKRWIVPQQGLARHPFFLGEIVTDVKIFPTMPHKKNICKGDVWLISPCATLCGVFKDTSQLYVVFVAQRERRKNKWFRLFFP